MFSSLNVLSSTIDPRPSLIWPLQVGKNFFSIDICCTTLSGHFSRASLYVRPVQHRFPRARAHLGSSSVMWPRFNLLEEGKIYVRRKSIKTYSWPVSISCLTKTIFFRFLCFGRFAMQALTGNRILSLLDLPPTRRCNNGLRRTERSSPAG